MNDWYYVFLFSFLKLSGPRLGRDGNGGKTAYLQLRVISTAYKEAFDLVFSAAFYAIITIVIAFTYLLLKGHGLPLFVRIIVILTDLTVFSFGYYTFGVVTNINVLSRKFIKNRSAAGEDSKFWAGMLPLRVGIGGTCTFETKEFLLVIWGDVVVSTLIDMLIAY